MAVIQNNKLLRSAFAVILCFAIQLSVLSGICFASDENINLLSNPGFEKQQESWATVSNSAVTSLWSFDSKIKHSGDYSLKACTAPQSQVKYDLSFSQYVAVDNSKNYEYSVWIKTADLTGCEAQVKIRECIAENITDATWYTDNNNAVLKSVSSTTDWQKYTVKISNLKTTTKYLRIYCQVTMNGTGGNAWFDDACLKEIEEHNNISNNGFEDGLWTNRSGTYEIDKSDFYEGSQSLKLTSSESQPSQCYDYFAVKPETSYTLSFAMKTDEVTAAAIKIRECATNSVTGSWFGDTSGSGYIADSDYLINKVTGSSAWEKYSVTINGIHKGTNYLKIYCFVTAGTGTAWFDDFALVENDYSNQDDTGAILPSVEQGKVPQGTTVKLKSVNTNADIFFTTDETDPANSPTRLLYDDDYGIIICKNTVIKARNFSENSVSDVCVFSYFCDDLLQNGGFENGFAEYQSLPLQENGGKSQIDSNIYKSGANSLKIESNTEEQLTYTDKISVNSQFDYELSFWYKTENIKNADGFSLNILQYRYDNPSKTYWYDLKIKSIFVTGYTQDWTKFTVVLDRFLDATTEISVRFRLDANMGGTAWVDDISVLALQHEKYPVSQLQSITQNPQGNIYVGVSKQRTFAVDLINNTNLSETVNFSEKIYDDDSDCLLSSKESEITFSPKQAISYFPDISAADYYGKFRIECTVTDNNQLFIDQKVYYISNVVSLPTENCDSAENLQNGYGAALHLEAWGGDYKKIIDQTVLSGVRWIRDGLKWANIETKKGVYTFPEDFDNYVDYANQKGINILVCVSGGNTLYGCKSNNYVPNTEAQIEGFANFAKAVAERYKGKVAAIEIWNEYNGSFNPTHESTSNYVAMMKCIYPKIKAVSEDINVVAGATSGNGYGWFIDYLLEGGYQYFDIASIHPYVLPDSPEENVVPFEYLKKLFISYGGEKPIWASEFGYSTFRDIADDYVPGYEYGTDDIGSKYIGVDEKTSAIYLSRMYTMMKAGYIDKVFWYDLINDDIAPYNREKNFGLASGFNTDSPLSAKSSLVAMRGNEFLLENASFVEKNKLYDSVQYYRFMDNESGTDISVLHSLGNISDAVSVNLTVKPLGQTVEVYDLYGNLIKTVDKNSSCIKISASPLFIKGNFQVVNVDNLAENGSFEDGIWEGQYYYGKRWQTDETPENVKDGKVSLKATTGTDYVGQQWLYVPIDCSKSYFLSAWIKTENITGASVKIRECTDINDTGTWYGKTEAQGQIADSDNNLVIITGSSSWKKYVFKTENFKPTTKYLKIYCSVEKGFGTAWFDGISLYRTDMQRGDYNADGEVNIKDLVRLKCGIAGDGSDCEKYDLDSDGSLGGSDLIVLRKILLGITL